MRELLFNQIALNDLKKVNELVLKGYYETSDYEEAVLALSNSLAMYHQEVSNENCKKGEYLQTSKLAKGA